VPAIGVTGGISTGKSTFTNHLRELLPQASFFDADVAARELTLRDADVLAEIRREFGANVFGQSDQLNRTALRSIVFGAPEKRRALESILHPRIRARWRGEAARHRESSDIFIADIPLLYETGGETLCDRVVVVACSRETQRERLMERTRMKKSEAEAMISAQIPLEEKVRRADHVVWNNGPVSALVEQAKLLVSLWMAP
jgi:dephospho-CoA kinase